MLQSAPEEHNQTTKSLLRQCLSYHRTLTLVTGFEPAIRLSEDISTQGTPYIPSPPDYTNTRLGASPHQCKIKQLFPHNPLKASQERTMCSKLPSFTQEAYQIPKYSVSCYHLVRLLQVNNLRQREPHRLHQQITYHTVGLCHMRDSNPRPLD